MSDTPKVVTVANPPPANFTPVAVHMPVKLRANAIQAVQDFVPLGKPNPEAVAAAKSLILSLINLLPEDVDGVEIKLEVSGHTAIQVMALVIPHKL